MKNSGQCPKCGGEDVKRISGGNPMQGYRNYVVTGLGGWVTSVLITRYLCLTCGYSEEWVDSQDDLEKIRKTDIPMG
ncbi:MAG: hypothetical protein GC154_08350 [bacterium]|nr:hypothetical protein [bacterium]